MSISGHGPLPRYNNYFVSQCIIKICNASGPCGIVNQNFHCKERYMSNSGLLKAFDDEDDDYVYISYPIGTFF